MDLKDTVKNALEEMEIQAPSIEISTDQHGNIFGFVASTSFKDITDEDAQKMVWEKLKEKLDIDQLKNVLLITCETPIERLARYGATAIVAPKKIYPDIWVHNCPDLNIYMIFVSTTKINNTYKASYVWIDDKGQSPTGLVFDYPEDVIGFMELEQQEIVPEIYENALENATTEIKSQIMGKYEKMTDQGVWGKNNIYNYVFSEFTITPIKINKIPVKIETIKSFKEKILATPESLNRDSAIEKLDNIIKISESGTIL